jgi:CDP-glycerol glycerophosphotransferase
MKKKDNLNKYNNKRAKILLKGIVPSLAALFVPKKKKRIILTSTRNEYYNFNSRYLFEYLIEHYPDYEVKYVINDAKKREELNHRFGVEKNYFIETETLSGMWYALKAKTWCTSALETPVGGIFQKIGRIVLHLGHGAYFRSALFIENTLPWYKRLYYHIIKNNFSHHLITSEAIAKIAPKMFGCKPEQIVVLGEPMNDRIFDPNIELFKGIFGEKILEDKNILYAPTWRQDGSLKLFPFDDMDWEDFVRFLDKNATNIYLRLHPSYEEDLTIYTERSPRIKIIDSQIVEDINEVIALFDLVITDYSSIYAGYLLLHKPLLFLAYDLEEYARKTGFVVPYEKATAGPKPDTFSAFKNEITRLLEDESYYLSQRQEANTLFNGTSRDKNAQQVAEFLMRQIGENQ